jgi:ATP-dependent Clp protease ATP-binding subunit ClpA
MLLQNRYSHHVHRALQHAEHLALQYGHAYQDTAHLLVGVMLTEGSLGAQVMEIFDMPIPVAKVYLKRLMVPSEHVTTPVPRDESFDKALLEAADEAEWLGSHYIGTEHLLLGITRTNLGNAIALLHLVDITPEQLRRRLRHVISDGMAEWSLETVRANYRLSELSRRVLNAAEQKAVSYDHPAVGIGHLLLALFRERRGITSDLLLQSGLDQEILQEGLDSSDRSLLVSIETVLDEAIRLAEKLGSHYVGADHLLLALTSSPGGIDMLHKYSISADKLRRLLQKHFK